MTKKFGLKDLIDRIEWQALSSGWTKNRLADNAVAVTYTENKKTPDQTKFIRVRFGIEIIKDLGWETGDTIKTSYDPNDVYSLLLVQSDLGGRKLSKESNSTVHLLTLSWRRDVVLKPSTAQLVEFDTYKNYIQFRLPA